MKLSIFFIQNNGRFGTYLLILFQKVKETIIYKTYSLIIICIWRSKKRRKRRNFIKKSSFFFAI